MRDLPLRHQTLHATIDWSYDLLDDEERVLLARLAVFQGGRTVESAEAVCGSDLSIEVMDGLESLLTKSLLFQEAQQGGELRFYMLETIHEYARARLDESGKAEDYQRRHAEYFMALAEQAEPELGGGRQSYWFERLRAEHDNLRTALAYAVGSGENELGLQIVGALRDFWYYGGHAGEGLGWIERALECALDAPPALRAKALNAAGWLSFIQGDYEHGQLFNREALVICRELGDGANSAWALLFLGAHCAGSLSEIKEGMALTEEALALFREQDNKHGVIRALNQIGELARLDGDYDRAGKAYEECLVMCRKHGDRQREAFALANSGFVAQHQGDYEQAESRIKKALGLSRDLRTNYGPAAALASLSGPVVARGDPERAARLLGASDALLRTMGLGLQPQDQREVDRFEAAVRGQLDQAAFEAAWAEGRAMSLEEAVAYALGEEAN
jgi:non-specific serine/threonine protein kinase